MQTFISSNELRTGRAVSRDVTFSCMFCNEQVHSDASYSEHLDEQHPGWAKLIIARMALNVPRVNG
jgi:hypothetical protein